jgi:hypothetical protein
VNSAEPLPLNYADPAVAGRGGRRWFETARRAALIGWLGCALAWGLVIGAATESVLITGPILMILGGVTVFAAARSSFRWAMLTGTGQCVLCGSLFVLVQLFHWGPSEARGPFLAIAATYIVLTAVPTIFVIAARCERL